MTCHLALWPSLSKPVKDNDICSSYLNNVVVTVKLVYVEGKKALNCKMLCVQSWGIIIIGLCLCSFMSINLHTNLGATQPLDIIFMIYQGLPVGQTSKLCRNCLFSLKKSLDYYESVKFEWNIRSYTVKPWFESIICSRNMLVIQSTCISKRISP